MTVAARAADIVEAARRDGSIDLGGLRLDMDGGADTLLVACAGLNPPGQITYAHEHTELELPTSRLYVSDRGNRWYLGGLPDLTRSLGETLELLAAIVARVAARRAVALGTSMGGYLSLLLGGQGCVDNAVAFAPQTNLDPDWRRRNGDERWSDELRAGHLALRGAAAPDAAALSAVAGRRLHVFYPTGEPLDVAHAARLTGQPGAFLYPVATRDHTLSRYLKRRGVLKRVITDIIAGGVPLQPILGLGEDPNDPEVAFHAGQDLLARGDLLPAEAAFRRAIAGDATANHYHNGLAHAVWRQGRHDEALAIVANAAAALHTDGYAQYNHGVFLARMERLAEAEACFRVAIWIEPREARFVEAQVRLLLRRDRAAEAKALCAETRHWVREPEAFERRVAGLLATP